MAKRQARRTAARAEGTHPTHVDNDFAITSPEDGESYCEGDVDSIPIEGTFSGDEPEVRSTVMAGLCDPGFNEHPDDVGAGHCAVDSGGTWSCGSISGGDVGEWCVVVWWRFPGQTAYSFQTISITILDESDPSCSSGSGSVSGSGGGGSGSASGFVLHQAAAKTVGRRRPAARAIENAAPRWYAVSVGTKELQLPEPAASMLPTEPVVRVARLEYHAGRSTAARAVWTSAASQARGHWVLEVRRNRHGRLAATLTLHRVGRTSVQPPLTWSGTWCFRRKRLTLAGAGRSSLPRLTLEAVE